MKKRCPMNGKVCFRSYRRAKKAATAAPDDLWIYGCRACGFLHLTSVPQAEYDRRQAEAAAGIRVQEFFEESVEVEHGTP